MRSLDDIEENLIIIKSRLEELKLIDELISYHNENFVSFLSMAVPQNKRKDIIPLLNEEIEFINDLKFTKEVGQVLHSLMDRAISIFKKIVIYPKGIVLFLGILSDKTVVEFLIIPYCPVTTLDTSLDRHFHTDYLLSEC